MSANCLMSLADLCSQNPRNRTAILVVLFTQIEQIHETFNTPLCEFIFREPLAESKNAYFCIKNYTPTTGYKRDHDNIVIISAG